MAKLIKRKKHNKFTIALLSPLLMIVFLVGWSLMWIGQSKPPKTKQLYKPLNKTPTKEEDFELIIINNPEEQILAN